MMESDLSKYSLGDVTKYSDKLLKLLNDEKINPAVFLHSLIFTSEIMIKQYRFVPKQVAEIRRQTRKLVDSIK
jgi:hypothetical protein